MRRGVTLTSNFALVVLAYTVPILILLNFMTREKNQEILFAQMEIKGNAYLRPLSHLLQGISKHRFYTHQLTSQEPLSAGASLLIAKLQDEISSGIQDLEHAQSLYGMDLLFTEEELTRRQRENLTVEKLKRDWNLLSGSRGSISSDVMQGKYRDLISRILGMMRYVGDTSRLILDPDLDSYYLMDVILLGVPQFQFHVQEVMNTLLKYRPHKTQRSIDSEISIHVHRIQLKSEMERIATSAQWAMNEDSRIRGINKKLGASLPVDLDKLSAQTDAFSNSILASIGPSAPNPNLDVMGLGVLNASQVFWKRSIDALDSLLEARIERLEASKQQSLLYVGLCWILAGILVFLAARAGARASAAAEAQAAKTAAAEAISRVKTTFIANVSHEIKTPLSVIRGFAELLASGNSTATERQEWISAILRSSQQLDLLTHDILDISKIEAGKIELERCEIDLSLLIAEINALFQLKAREKGISLCFSVEGSIPAALLTDSLRVKQILLNLIGNALKFTQKGRVDVLIKLLPDLSKIPRLAFIISDTGLGMSPQQAEKIFQVFGQADNSISRRYGGTGLGLTLSRLLARLLGGDVVLSHSEPGVGSTFTATIDPGPLNGVEMLKDLKLTIPSSCIEINASPEGPALQGIRVLCVEDAPDIGSLIALNLCAQGAIVNLATNGQEGLDMARMKHYDVVFMDIQMPLLDGYDATRQLREEGCQLPILALTAHAMVGERERCLAAGFTDYLTKPINMKKLLKMVEDYGIKA